MPWWTRPWCPCWSWGAGARPSGWYPYRSNLPALKQPGTNYKTITDIFAALLVGVVNAGARRVKEAIHFGFVGGLQQMRVDQDAQHAQRFVILDEAHAAHVGGEVVHDGGVRQRLVAGPEVHQVELALVDGHLNLGLAYDTLSDTWIAFFNYPKAAETNEKIAEIDRFDEEGRANLMNIAARRPHERPCFPVSAETGEGIDALLAAIEDRLATTRVTLDLTIDPSDGAGISWLHRNAEVLDKHMENGRFAMTVRVDISKRDITIAKFGAVPSLH